MQQDPEDLVYSSVETADLTADVINSLVTKLEWKTIWVIVMMLFGSILVCNLSLGFNRN